MCHGVGLFFAKGFVSYAVGSASAYARATSNDVSRQRDDISMADCQLMDVPRYQTRGLAQELINRRREMKLNIDFVIRK
jgi:hypothetical protein